MAIHPLCMRCDTVDLQNRGGAGSVVNCADNGSTLQLEFELMFRLQAEKLR